MRYGRLACALACLTALASAIATPAAAQETTTTLRTTCAPGESPAANPDLSGIWDFYMDVGGEPSFGLLTISRLDGAYGGTLTPVRTAPLIVRRITVDGPKVALIVASLEGDVAFNATLSGDGYRLCGIVDYHGGLKLPMVAQRRRGMQPAAVAAGG